MRKKWKMSKNAHFYKKFWAFLAKKFRKLFYKGIQNLASAQKASQIFFPVQGGLRFVMACQHAIHSIPHRTPQHRNDHLTCQFLRSTVRCEVGRTFFEAWLEVEFGSLHFAILPLRFYAFPALFWVGRSEFSWNLNCNSGFWDYPIGCQNVVLFSNHAHFFNVDISSGFFGLTNCLCRRLRNELKANTVKSPLFMSRFRTSFYVA